MPPILKILLGGFGAVQVMAGLMHLYPPLWNYIQQSALKSWPNVLPTNNELVEMYFKNAISDSEFYNWMEEQGYSKEQSNNFLKSSENFLNVIDYINLNRRGELTDEVLKDRLKILKLSDEEIELAKRASLFFPSPVDLIRFAVREVYSDEYIQQYGMMNDLPERFLQESSKSGLKEEHAKQYWAAHWELPSVNMGYEMFHRRIINEEQLKMLMRALDIMPGWRDSLIQLSYNPLTRVDVRRMYELGVIDEEEMYNAFLDRGYSPENASRMVEFSIEYTNDELSGITRAQITSAFKKDLISQNDYANFLKELGYSEAVVNFYVNTTIYDKDEELLDDTIKEYYDRYKADIMTEKEILDDMQRRVFAQTLIDKVKRKLQLIQSQKVKIPSKSDLETWLKLQVIDEKTYMNKMTKLGYLKEDILRYISEIAIEVDTSKIKYLADSVYFRWYSTSIIEENEFRNIMTDKGVGTRDINNYVKEGKIKRGET
jgi:hypothetical protein